MTDPDASRLSTWGNIAPFGDKCRRWVDAPGGGRVFGLTDRSGRREYSRARRDVSVVDGEGGREESSVSR